MIRVEALVLAAGESRRMGRPKPLLPWNGATLIAHIVDALQSSQVHGTNVVTGHQGAEVAQALAGTTARCIPNPDYRDGMLSSVRAGLRALAEQTDAVLLCLCDQPHLPPALVDGLIDCYDADVARIVVPSTQGRRGHPLLFSFDYRDEILAGYDDTGLRGLLERHADALLHWNTDDGGILVDLDTPEDYARALASGYHVPEKKD